MRQNGRRLRRNACGRCLLSRDHSIYTFVSRVWRTVDANPVSVELLRRPYTPRTCERCRSTASCTITSRKRRRRRRPRVGRMNAEQYFSISAFDEGTCLSARWNRHATALWWRSSHCFFSAALARHHFAMSVTIYELLAEKLLQEGLTPQITISRVLLRCLEVSPFIKDDLKSLDFVIYRFFMKLFRTSNTETVRLCQLFLVRFTKCRYWETHQKIYRESH